MRASGPSGPLVLKSKNFLTHQLKHMLWVLKRTVSLVLTTYVLVEKKKGFWIFGLFDLIMSQSTFTSHVSMDLPRLNQY